MISGMYFHVNKDICDYSNKLEYPAELNIFKKNSAFAQIETRYEIAYFAKFNALHDYIIKNFNNNKDDGSVVYLELSQCKQILYTLRIAIADTASRALPITSGPAKYDDYYFECVHDAVRIFTDIVALLENYPDYYISYTPMGI